MAEEDLMDEDLQGLGDGEDQPVGDVPALPLPAAAPIAAPRPAATGLDALPPNWWIRKEEPQIDYGRVNAIRDLYNAVPAKEASQAVEMATRLQGVLGFDADVKAGVPTVEALRKWAPKMYFNHPGAVSRLIQPPFQPGVTNVGGQNLIQTSPNRYQLLPAPAMTQTGNMEARPITTPEGKVLGYGLATKGGVHPRWNVAEVPEVKISDEIRRFTALAKGYENAAKLAESETAAADYTRKQMQALDALQNLRTRKAMIAPASSGELPTITTQAQYDKLPSGAYYLNGKSNRKHKKP
jgi:hypothetical protein